MIIGTSLVTDSLPYCFIKRWQLAWMEFKPATFQNPQFKENILHKVQFYL